MGEVVAMRLSVIIPVKRDPRLARCLAAPAGNSLDHDLFDVLVASRGSPSA